MVASAMTASERKRVGAIVQKLCDSEDVDTTTKAGWCLKEGLTHIVSVDDSRLLSLIQQHGVPQYLAVKNGSSQCRHAESKKTSGNISSNSKPPESRSEAKTCFQSLCRIVAGQFVSGHAANAAYKRLLGAVASYEDQVLTPRALLALAGPLEIGMTKAKTRTILSLAEKFVDGSLSDEFLETASSDEVRKALLQVRGIGPWSCDVFLQFHLHHPNILPLGDLGVRKGISRIFLNGQTFCPKKDGARIRTRLQMYEPFQSLVTYYMWRAVDIVPTSVTGTAESATVPVSSELAKQNEKRAVLESVPATTPRKKRSVSRTVTPEK